MAKLTSSELIQKLANAKVTYFECTGHFKAKQNEIRVLNYTEQLTKMGVTIPSDDELEKLGIYNGDGSF